MTSGTSVTISERFLESWFGCPPPQGGREIGTPTRLSTLAESVWDLIEFGISAEAEGVGVYMSSQPYRSRDVPYGVERLYWDFDADPRKGHTLDDAWKDAKTFALKLRHDHKLDPVILFSGRRGYHIHVFFERILEVPPQHLEILKETYDAVQRRLVGSDAYRTLDGAVVGDIKRLHRVPSFKHQDSGLLCRPVDLDRSPIDLESVDQHRTAPKSLVQDAYREYSKKVVGRRALAAFNAFGRRQPSNIRGAWAWIGRLLTTSIPDGRHRLCWQVVAPYLVTIEGLDADSAFEILAQWNEINGSPMNSAFMRSQLRHAKTIQLRPKSIRRIQAEWPDVYRCMIQTGVVMEDYKP